MSNTYLTVPSSWPLNSRSAAVAEFIRTRGRLDPEAEFDCAGIVYQGSGGQDVYLRWSDLTAAMRSRLFRAF